jgi:hypothetical protein
MIKLSLRTGRVNKYWVTSLLSSTPTSLPMLNEDMKIDRHSIPGVTNLT